MVIIIDILPNHRFHANKGVVSKRGGGSINIFYSFLTGKFADKGLHCGSA